MSVPVIVDCDPGHDDVFAVWLAAGHPSLELVAITTVGGNVPLEHTSRNARIALTVAGVSGVPVAAGAAGPIARTLETAEWIHGENGLGGPELPEPAMPLDPRGATELMADTLLASTSRSRSWRPGRSRTSRSCCATAPTSPTASARSSGWADRPSAAT